MPAIFSLRAALARWAVAFSRSASDNGAREPFAPEWPERAGGAGGPGHQSRLDQPLQGFVRGAVNDFQAHGRERVRLAGAKIILMQRVEFFAPLGGVAFHDDI